jgi:hypothetical protein
MSNGTTGTGTTNGLLVGLDGSGNAYVNQQENLPLFLRTNNTTRLTVGTSDITSTLPITAPSLIKSGGTSAQFLKADGSVDGNTYLTSSDISGKLNISDTSTMLSNYRRTTTKITNTDLANSTISGVSLGGTLNSLSAGSGLVGTAYNGSASQTFRVDTGRVATQIVTGGSLNKVRDSVVSLISASATESGTYTPTLTAVSNVSSTLATVCQYMKVGSVVTISGKVRVTGTTAGTTATISITLPFAQNNFGNSYEAGGSGGFISSNTYYGATLSSNSSAQTIALSYIPTSFGNDEIYFTVTYQIK